MDVAPAPRLDLTEAEAALLDGCLRMSGRFFGFGATGAVCRAAGLVGSSVVALDGSRERLAALAAECRQHADWTQPHLIHVDIGPTNDLGHPTDPATQDRWASYPRRPWSVPGVAETELYLIGGRFRVACALQTLLHCRADAIMLFQTYQPRREYHVVGQFAREVARAGALSAFIRRADFDPARAGAILDRFGLVTT